jgi:hypothetical protein
MFGARSGRIAPSLRQESAPPGAFSLRKHAPTSAVGFLSLGNACGRSKASTTVRGYGAGQPGAGHLLRTPGSRTLRDLAAGGPPQTRAGRWRGLLIDRRARLPSTSRAATRSEEPARTGAHGATTQVRNVACSAFFSARVTESVYLVLIAICSFAYPQS